MNAKNSNPVNGLGPRTTPLGRLTTALRENLISKCEPGDMMPSERSLSGAFHASRSTIHKALEQLHRQGWIRRLPGQGYMVKRPPRQPHQTTGLFFPTNPFSLLMVPFYRDVYLGISQAAAANKRHVVSFFGTGRRSGDVSPDEFWSPSMRAVDSLLTLEVFDESLIGQAAGFYPLVCLDMPCRLPTVSSVCFDHSASIQMAFKYLLDLGHRRIGYVGKRTSKDPADAERYTAFERALRWTGEAVVGDPMFHATGGPTGSIVARWLGTPPDQRSTALIVTHSFWDLVARLHLAGVPIPRDVSLVQVGSLSTWPDYASMIISRYPKKTAVAMLPALQPPFNNLPTELASLAPTTVRLPSSDMGRQGLLELVRRKADSSAEPRHQVLAPQLVHGTTSRPLR